MVNFIKLKPMMSESEKVVGGKRYEMKGSRRDPSGRCHQQPSCI